MVVDLLRLGKSVAVVGAVGVGKSVVMNVAEQTIARTELSEQVTFVHAWEPGLRLSKGLVVIEAYPHQLDQLPAGFMIAPVLTYENYEVGAL